MRGRGRRRRRIPGAGGGGAAPQRSGSEVCPGRAGAISRSAPRPSVKPFPRAPAGIGGFLVRAGGDCHRKVLCPAVLPAPGRAGSVARVRCGSLTVTGCSCQVSCRAPPRAFLRACRATGGSAGPGAGTSTRVRLGPSRSRQICGGRMVGTPTLLLRCLCCWFYNHLPLRELRSVGWVWKPCGVVV